MYRKAYLKLRQILAVVGTGWVADIHEGRMESIPVGHRKTERERHCRLLRSLA